MSKSELAELERCKTDFVYFVEKCLSIGDEKHPVRLNESQRQLLREIEQDPRLD